LGVTQSLRSDQILCDLLNFFPVRLDESHIFFRDYNGLLRELQLAPVLHGRGKTRTQETDMEWYVKTTLVTVGILCGSACKELQQGQKKSAPTFQAPAGAATGADNPMKTPAPEPAKPEGPVEAKLTGYPEAKSPNSQFDIGVTGVAEYKWKQVESATDCQLSGGYSNYAAATTPIKIDLASRRESPAIIAICVIGKSASGMEQANATLASWVWAPEIPTISDQIDMIEGSNEIKITPKAPAGNWLIIRSREALSAMPEDGKEYAANQAIGNGTVVVAGPMAEFIDKTVKNTESWTYTFVAYNNSRRFSVPLTKSMTLSQQELQWVPNNLVKAGQVPLESRPNNKRYVCRAQFADPTTGENRGMHPGVWLPANNNNADLKAGNCFFEYGGVVYRSINYDLLMANKGNPVDMIRWARGAVGANNNTIIPNGAILAGTDDTGATRGPGLYICLGANLNFPGKAGAHLNGGCSSYNNQNNVPNRSTTFDVLVFK
jgi:hypothetical protein